MTIAFHINKYRPTPKIESPPISESSIPPACTANDPIEFLAFPRDIRDEIYRVAVVSPRPITHSTGQLLLRTNHQVYAKPAPSSTPKTPCAAPLAPADGGLSKRTCACSACGSWSLRVPSFDVQTRALLEAPCCHSGLCASRKTIEQESETENEAKIEPARYGDGEEPPQATESLEEEIYEFFCAEIAAGLLGHTKVDLLQLWYWVPESMTT
ncbi:MAG: hypothetical protein M1829_004013 [Trizodia sp. TS-e1964]|nr:MAG: hypothetical protein M1829_004013 [Trizodia sp. TS-e1964]